MELREAIENRHSIRGFLKKPVKEEILREVLELAVRAVSANNVQPWNFLVVAGEELEKLKEANLQDYRKRCEEDYSDIPITGKYKDRAREVGKQLFAAMNILREDKAARNRWSERGYMFFDAPAVILLYLDKDMDETAYRFDLGCVAQNICLAAMEKGLGTCVENQAINYQRGIREVLGISGDKKFVCGIAIGYPDEDFKANRVVTNRVPLDEVTIWKGFNA